MPSSRQLTMVNDVFVDHLRVEDRGLAFGDGLFETMRFTAGAIPLIEYHLDRLEWGCRTLLIPMSRTLVQSSLSRFVEAISDPGPSIIKLIVTRGSGGQGCRPPSMQCSYPSLVWQNLPLTDTAHLALSGVTLQPCRIPIYSNPHLAGIKHLNRLNYVMAAFDLPDNPEVQGLVSDETGHILESLHHNLFLVKKNLLMTPLLDRAGVKGVLRRLILERFASNCGLAVKEAAFSIDELLLADEVFLTNGVRGIWPVKGLATTRWPSPGPVTARLQSLTEAMFAGGHINKEQI